MRVIDLVKKALGPSIKTSGGAEWWCCPFHKESKPSFNVNEDVYHCFGCGAGGGAKKWLMEYQRMSEAEAKRYLANGGSLPDVKTAYKGPFKTLKVDLNTSVYTYKNLSGREVGVVWRQDRADGTKNIRQYIKRADGYYAEGLPKPTPLYNINTAISSAQVMVVEGEKVVCALQTLKADIPVVCWCGGAHRWSGADWTVLSGKKVLLIADADEPGRECMKKLSNHLRGLGIAVSVILPDGDTKWDLADGVLGDGWTMEMVNAWIHEQLSSEDVEDDKEYDLIANLEENKFYKIVGRSANGIVFYLKVTNEFVDLRYADLSAKSYVRLAPLYWWCMISGEPNIKSINATLSLTFADTLIRCAQSKGKFNYDRLVGRGAYSDPNDTDVVYHLGTSVLVGKDEISLADANSRLYGHYAEGVPITVSSSDCTDDDLKALVAALWGYRWQNQWHVQLLLGWIVAALLGGGLSWRAHLWLIGASSTGKSWLIGNVIKRILGDACMIGSDITEASLARLQCNDALPIIIDEAEPRRGGAIHKIVDLIRTTSDGLGMRMRASGDSHNVVKFQPRFTALLSSISVPTMQYADLSRYIFIKLSSTPVNDWEFVKRLIDESCAKSDLIKSSIINNRVDIYRHIDEVREVLAEDVESIRSLDNMSQLLGCYRWLADRSRKNIEKINKNIRGVCREALREHLGKVESYDGLLHEVLSLRIRDGVSDELVSTLLRKLYTNKPFDTNPVVDYGLRFSGDNILIATRSPLLRRGLSGTPYEGMSLKELLMQIPGVIDKGQSAHRFNSARWRHCVEIPPDVYSKYLNLAAEVRDIVDVEGDSGYDRDY